jgi:peroxiredoxin
MRRQWLIVAAVLGALVAGVILAVRVAPSIYPVEVNSRAPDFRAVDLATGDTVGLDRYRGKVVLLNIWATWCQPCRAEMPSMQRLWEEFRDQDFAIVAVSIDETEAEDVRAFQREFGLTFDVLQDRTRAIERIYQTTGVPESFVIRRNGVIMKKAIGAHAWDAPTNRDLVRRLLAQSE